MWSRRYPTKTRPVTAMSSLSAIVVLRAVVPRGESVVVGMDERYPDLRAVSRSRPT